MSLTFKYQRQNGDEQYRIVSLLKEVASEWTDFQGSTVEYSEQCVLEIRRKGQEKPEIAYERITRNVTVGRDGDQLFLAQGVPTARIWLRTGDGMRYKVPARLLEKDGYLYMYVPGGTQNAVLFGDEYFSKAYCLTMG